MTRESSRNHDSEEQQRFIYDDPNTPPEQESPDYFPEREFVLMPLLRRIGDILGIRRKSDDEHVYTPETSVPQTRVIDLDDMGGSSPEVPEEHDHVLLAAMQAEAEATATPEFDVLGIEQEVQPEPTISEQSALVMAAEAREPELEPVMTVPEVRAEPEPVIVDHEPIAHESPLAHVSEESLAVPVVASEADKTASPAQLVVARETRPQPAPARPVLTQEDIAQLIAPITEAAREAAAKISAAMSQAAEWLHTKEEEIVRRAEMALESKRTGVSQSSAADPPKWESYRAPALQREAAWVESGGIPVTRANEARPAKRRPVAFKPKRAALWKRIDWAQEFTPKRVAVLGGIAMAMLMVVGVSLARRPASSVLPQETTHALQPGGVTLTTHPRPTLATAATAPVTAKANPVPPQRPAVAATHSTRRAANDGGPDVVTHYYSKQKPSPVHQSTVAGVKHYSDMESR